MREEDAGGVEEGFGEGEVDCGGEVFFVELEGWMRLEVQAEYHIPWWMAGLLGVEYLVGEGGRGGNRTL